MCLRKKTGPVFLQVLGPDSGSVICKHVDCFACMEEGKEGKRERYEESVSCTHQTDFRYYDKGEFPGVKKVTLALK